MERQTGVDAVLRDITVLVTRPRTDAQSLVDMLEIRGARVLTAPVIRITSPIDRQPLDDALLALHHYDWIAFTSRNAVRATIGRMREINVSLPTSIRVAAIGAGTNEELTANGIVVTAQPTRASAIDLAAAMLALGPGHCTVLQPAGNRARPDLRDRLAHAGILVEVVEAYQTITDDLEEGPTNINDIDVVALASPSALHALVNRFGLDALRGVELACIGTTTAEAVRSTGLEPAGIAREPSNAGLATAILEMYQRRGGI